MRQHHRIPKTIDRPLQLGVTLVEVLVSVAIVALLLALLLPAIASARRSADGVLCRSRLSQIGRASHNFEERTRHLPNGYGDLDWQFDLLPDLDLTDLYRQLKENMEDGVVLFGILDHSSIPVLQCPSDTRGTSNRETINFLINGGSMFDYYESESREG